MVRIHPDPPGIRESAAGGRGQCGGAVAQLGERLLCKQEAVGSIPSGSTRQGTGNREQKDHRQAWGLTSGFLARRYRLFFNNAEEVKGLALSGRSWRELGRVGWGETGLDCIGPFVL